MKKKERTFDTIYGGMVKVRKVIGKLDIIKLRRMVLISKILTKLCRNTSQRVTYVLITKMLDT